MADAGTCGSRAYFPGDTEGLSIAECELPESPPHEWHEAEATVPAMDRPDDGSDAYDEFVLRWRRQP